MSKIKLTSKHLRNIGYTNNAQISQAMQVVGKNFKYQGLAYQLELLKKIFDEPELFIEDKILKTIALALMNKTLSEDNPVDFKNYELYQQPIPYKIFGASQIESEALLQMDTAMRLPISVCGALMPDAHGGYGLPIGGVLATKDAVIPYAVGMDIGCRMSLTIYDLPENFIDTHLSHLKQILLENTRFGNNQVFKENIDSEVLERADFKELEILRKLRHYAVEQLGTSGSGNHFVEFGLIEILQQNDLLSVSPGKYLGLLAHSGSRHFGYEIAQHFSKIAMAKCKLPAEARHLAWLNLDSSDGQEYMISMNLAGDYAKANHDYIHKRISKVLGKKPIAKIENHHNFAWKEKMIDGTELIVHRKGATPAFKNILGLIPGSMATPCYIVIGKGSVESLNSASHGAGRLMSRTKALKKFSKKDLNQFLKKERVELIGGGLDEAPMAYKNIHEVIKAQTDLVSILGTFQPRIVRMDG